MGRKLPGRKKTELNRTEPAAGAATTTLTTTAATPSSANHKLQPGLGLLRQFEPRLIAVIVIH